MPTKQTTQRTGGSFAPPLTDEKLAAYELLVPTEPGPLRDSLLTCLKCVKNWWGLPDSTESVPLPHPSGMGAIVPLDAPIAKALWDDIPWGPEILMIQSVFDAINPVTHAALCNAAFHLLWHVKELNADREPITTDKL